VYGRTYTPTAGAYVDAPANDADALEANLWTRVAAVGPTALRPAVAGTSQEMMRGCKYIDTDLSAMLQHDGAVWRDVISGAPA
jgi:hypothetical protein